LNPTEHHSNNAVLGAPAGWDQGATPCSTLSITRLEVDGLDAMVSFWRPTNEELQQLASGGLVSLWIFGAAHPVISVGVQP
jgi:hypothetical protein